MLPQPVGSRHAHSHRPFGTNFLASSHASPLGGSLGGSLDRPPKVRELLRQRSRVTNLALLLLISILAISLVANFRSWAGGGPDGQGAVSWGRERDGELSASGQTTARPHPFELAPPSKSIADTIEITDEMRALSHLVVVAGHGIWTGHDPTLHDQDDQWLLEPYQRGGQTTKAMWRHIKAASELAVSDPASLLVFSGGWTRPLAATSEAQSYYHLATSSDLLPAPFHRVTTEEFALDSFQNLLFSIARFHEITGSYPLRITVVGFGVKSARFKELHRAAIRYPVDKFDYIGIDLAGDVSTFVEGERQNGYLPFTSDLYGCRPPLVSKRRRRNPFARFHPYLSSAPQLRDLIEFCPTSGAGQVYEGSLPWDEVAKS